MVRETRIKEYIFPTQNIAAVSAGLTITTDHIINGEILQVELGAFNQSGNIALKPSGLSVQTIWSNNASGGTTVVNYPRAYVHDTAGNQASGTPVEPFIVNDALVLTTGSLTSGASANLNVTVKYR